jgi:hypothetical protein
MSNVEVNFNKVSNCESQNKEKIAAQTYHGEDPAQTEGLQKKEHQ